MAVIQKVKNSQRRLSLVVGLLFIAMLLVSPSFFSGLKVDANLLNMLPTQDRDANVEIIRQNLGMDETQSLVILLQGKEITDIQEQLILARKQLFSSDLIQEQSISNDDIKNLQQLYAKHRFGLLSREDKAILLDGDTASFTQRTLKALYSPTSHINSNSLRQDPFQLLHQYLLEKSNKSDIYQGHVLLTESDELTLILQAKLNFDAFDTHKRKRFIELFDQFIAETNTLHQPYYSGAVFYADKAEQGAREEITLFGGMSTILIILLMLYFFRSLKSLVFVLTTVALACFTGLFAVAIGFGEINLVALAFATSLIGICIDYCAHYLVEEQYAQNNHSDQNTKSPYASANKINVALGLSLLTTIFAYCLMFLSPFPGLSQVTIFVAAGLIGTYLLVQHIFPLFIFKTLQPSINPFSHSKIAAYFANANGHQWHKNIAWMVAGLFAVMLLLLAVTSKKENLRGMYYQAEELMEMQSQMASKVDFPDINKLLYVTASDAESLLVNLEAAEEKLHDIKQQAPDFKWLSVSQWIPSQATQLENAKLIQSLNETQISKLGAQLGLSASNFELGDAAIQGKNLLSLKASAELLPENIQNLFFEKDDIWYAVILMFNTPSHIDFEHYVNDSSQATYVDYLSLLESAIGEVKEFLILALVFTFILVAGVLIWKYKSAAVLSVLFNSLVAINALLALMLVNEQTMTIFHVFALFLILGMNLDFVFIFSSGKGSKTHAALSCSIGAITTLFAFGMLGFSQTPAVALFGQSVAIGIGVGWIAALYFGSKTQQFESLYES